MPKLLRHRQLRYSLRGLVVVLTVFCVWFGFRVQRSHQQQLAMERLKSRGTFLYQTQEDTLATILRRSTGTLAYGDVVEIILAHDVYKPLPIEFDPDEIDHLKDFPYLKTLHIHSSQRTETILRLADVTSLEVVGLHTHDATDPGVLALRRLRPDLQIITK